MVDFLSLKPVYHKWLLILVLTGATALLLYRRQKIESPKTEKSEEQMPQSVTSLPQIPVRGLSFFEPYAGGCEWQYYDIKRAKRELIARLPADCAGVHVTWHPQGESALIWIDNDSSDMMTWLVELRTKALTRFTGPPTESVKRFAYAAIGKLLAFSMSEDQQTTIIAWQYDPHRKNSPWQSIEAALVDTDSVIDWRKLSTFQHLFESKLSPYPHGLARWQSLASNEDEELPKEANIQIQKELNQKLPKGMRSSDGVWRVRAAKNSPTKSSYLFFQWYMQRGSKEPTGLIFFSNGKRWEKPLTPYQARDFIVAEELDSWLLLKDNLSGMRPHLYDMQDGKLLLSANYAHETTFWPPVRAPGE